MGKIICNTIYKLQPFWISKTNYPNFERKNVFYFLTYYIEVIKCTLLILSCILIIIHVGSGNIRYKIFTENSIAPFYLQNWDEMLFINNNGDIWKWDFDISIPGVITDNSTIELVSKYKLEIPFQTLKNCNSNIGLYKIDRHWLRLYLNLMNSFRNGGQVNEEFNLLMYYRSRNLCDYWNHKRPQQTANIGKDINGLKYLQTFLIIRDAVKYPICNPDISDSFLLFQFSCTKASEPKVYPTY